MIFYVVELDLIICLNGMTWTGQAVRWEWSASVPWITDFNDFLDFYTIQFIGHL